MVFYVGVNYCFSDSGSGGGRNFNKRIPFPGNSVEELGGKNLAQEKIGHIRAVFFALLEIAGSKLVNGNDYYSFKVHLIINGFKKIMRDPVAGAIIFSPMRGADEENLNYCYGGKAE
jgi:hypothetical protein